MVTGATKESHFKSNRGDSESDILEQTPDTDDSGPHSCPGEWTKHSNNSIKNIHPHKAKKIHNKVTNPTIKETAVITNSQKVRYLQFYKTLLLNGATPFISFARKLIK